MDGMDEQQPVTVAAFDFDGTISTRDSLLPFLFFTKGAIRTLLGLLWLSPYLIFRGFPDRHGAKERIFTHFFKGVALEEFQKLADLYAETKLTKLIRPKALERIKWHKKQGHRLLIISASVEHYLKPWAKVQGFEAVLATKLATDDHHLTGKISGRNCRCEEKVKRLDSHLNLPKESYELYAYGDTRGDRELLAFSDHPGYRPFHN